MIKYNMLRKLITFLFLLLVFLVFSKPTSASILYLSPAKTAIGQGLVTSVQVRLNTQGEVVNAVSAYLAYPADKLEVAWINYGGSFSIAAEGSYGGGGIRISRGSFSGVTGNISVATIGFRGKALGQTNVSFIGGSAAPRVADSSDSLNLGGSGGGSYNVVKASEIPTPVKGPAPKISNISVSDISTNSALITWKTDVKTDSNIEYGFEKGKYFLSLSDSKLNTEHSFKLESPAFIPGQTIYFHIKAKNSDEDEAISDENNFHLRGYKISIRINDKLNKFLKNVEVTLFGISQKKTTNDQGQVIFEDISPGTHLVILKSKDFEKTSEIKVIESPDIQNFELKFIPLTQASQFPMNIAYLVIILEFIFFVFLIGFILKRKKSEPRQTFTPLQPPNLPKT